MMKMLQKDYISECSTEVSMYDRDPLAVEQSGPMVPDYIEFESTRTKMYKIVAESYCLKSPEYALQWEIKPCKVDLNVKSTIPEKGTKGFKTIKHEATLHTLKYVKSGHEIRENYAKFNQPSENPMRNMFEYYEGVKYGGYKPPKVYNLNGKNSTNNALNMNQSQDVDPSTDLNQSLDVDSINDMENFIKYINSNIV